MQYCRIIQYHGSFFAELLAIRDSSDVIIRPAKSVQPTAVDAKGNYTYYYDINANYKSMQG